MSGEHVPALRDAFEETAYRAALQTLGLVDTADKDAIHKAYRERAKRWHPDRFQSDEERSAATKKIQEINAAHTYALQHWQGYQLARRWGGRTPARMGEAPSWHDWLFVPVTAVYALTTIAAAAPVVALTRLVGSARRERWREGRVTSLVWRVWLLIGPHGATLFLFAAVDEFAVKAWFGASFLVMLSADVATLVTGDPNTLRRQLSGTFVKLP